MHVKNRTIINRANLVKVYSGHVLLQSLGFFFLNTYFHLLFLTLWKTTVKNRERIIPHRHVLSAFQHIFFFFLVESMGWRHLPGCWPLSA